MAERRRGGAGRLIRRIIFSILAIIILAAVVAVVAVELAGKANNVVVHYQHIIANDAQSAIDQVKSFIAKYTTTKK